MIIYVVSGGVVVTDFMATKPEIFTVCLCFNRENMKNVVDPWPSEKRKYGRMEKHLSFHF